MKIDIHRDGDAATITPRGDLVASSVPELRPAMLELVRAGVRGITMDLAETAMIDSTGIGLLLSAYNSLRSAQGRFAIVNASAEIVELLRTMRIHQHFDVAGR